MDYFPALRLRELRARDPAAWRATIRDALRAAGGHVRRAALVLGISTTHLRQLLRDCPELRERRDG